MGGAERVVYELHKMYPDAPIYTSSFNKKKMPLFKDADVRTSFIQKLPFGKKHQLWPVLRRFYFGNLKLKDYDLVISSSGAEAKAVRAPNGAHINYCHSPTHYYWVRPKEYQLAKSAGGSIFRTGLKILTPWMKRWDYKVAQRPDYMVCNSTITRERIKKYYKRDADVIYPPIDTKRFKEFNFKEREGFVSLGRQVHYMRRDLPVLAFNEITDKLKVIGRGPEHENLKSLSKNKKTSFHANYSDKQVALELSSAEALISAGVEDFCITAVEAMAAGTPVIGIKDGGILDTVIEGKTGVMFEEQTAESLVEAISKFKEQKFDHEYIKNHAKKFDTTVFHKNMKKYIKRVLLTKKGMRK